MAGRQVLLKGQHRPRGTKAVLGAVAAAVAAGGRVAAKTGSLQAGQEHKNIKTESTRVADGESWWVNAAQAADTAWIQL
jgi:hypothetical protein